MVLGEIVKKTLIYLRSPRMIASFADAFRAQHASSLPHPCIAPDRNFIAQLNINLQIYKEHSSRQPKTGFESI